MEETFIDNKCKDEKYKLSKNNKNSNNYLLTKNEF